MDEERDRLRMCQEWNEIARLNPFFGILSWPEFQDPACIDEQKFELSGKIQAENFLASIGMETGALCLTGPGESDYCSRY